MSTIEFGLRAAAVFLFAGAMASPFFAWQWPEGNNLPSSVFARMVRRLFGAVLLAGVFASLAFAAGRVDAATQFFVIGVSGGPVLVGMVFYLWTALVELKRCLRIMDSLVPA